MAYFRLPVETNFDQLLIDALGRINNQFPDWVPRESHLEVAILEEMTRLAQEAAQVTAEVPDRIFERFGEEIFGISPVEAVPASASAEFTVVDDAGYVIPAGTIVGFEDDVGELVLFATDSNLVIGSGETSGSVTVVAEEPGELGNGFGPGSARLVDARRELVSVSFLDSSAGGVSAETPQTYRDRLAVELALQAPRPILPEDFVAFARRDGSVFRAQALDGYDPDAETFGNERMITLALVGPDGLPVGAAAQTRVQDGLEALREVNFVVHTIDPVYTEVDVVFEVVATPGISLQLVEDRCVDRVEEVLSPARFGGGDQNPPIWMSTLTVRRNALIAELARVDGVMFVSLLELNGSEDDVTLDGPAGLPAPFVEPEPSDPWSDASTVSGSAVLPGGA